MKNIGDHRILNVSLFVGSQIYHSKFYIPDNYRHLLCHVLRLQVPFRP